MDNSSSPYKKKNSGQIKDQSSKRVVFLGHNALIDMYIVPLAENCDVLVFHNDQASSPSLGRAAVQPVKYHFFGLLTLVRLFKLEVSTPARIVDCVDHLTQYEPTDIIAMDFFRESFWQALAYVKSTPGVRLHLYCETKKIPKNIFSKMASYYYLQRLRNSFHAITNLWVYTGQGLDFFKEHVPDLPATLLPIPINTDHFPLKDDSLSSAKKPIRILCNSRYASYKRHKDLFLAIKVLRERNVGVAVTCIGRADAGQVKVQLLAEEVGVQDLVTFLDPVPQSEIVTIYHRHDVLVLPSYNEAIGMVVPEAMSCGLPTITSDTVGANVYVKKSETGFIFETGNVDALAEAIEKMTDMNLRRRMGECAAKHVRDNFTIDKCSERFKIALEIK